MFSRIIQGESSEDCGKGKERSHGPDAAVTWCGNRFREGSWWRKRV